MPELHTERLACTEGHRDAAILRAAAAVVEAREATAPWLSGIRERLLALADEQPRAEPDHEQVTPDA